MKKVVAVFALAMFVLAIAPVSAQDKAADTKKETSCAKKDTTKKCCAKDCSKPCCKKDAK